MALTARSFSNLYGAKVDVNSQGRHFRTGEAGWKAVKEVAGQNDVNTQNWMRREYSGCAWPDAVEVTTSRNVTSREAGKFAHRSKAEYIWARNGGKGDIVYVRFVVGGEDCSKVATEIKVPTAGRKSDGRQLGRDDAPVRDGKGNPRKASSRNTEVMNTVITGHGDDMDEDLCTCKPVAGARGTCWELKGGKSGSCELRDCEPTYECVRNDGTSVLVCQRKVVKERLIRSVDGRCETVAVPAVEVYMPYGTIM